MLEPRNEAETIVLYKLVQEQLGWRIVHLQTAFPDAIIENARGQRLVVEFECQAKNFKWHGHDPADCDLIVCWTNDWADTPIPVWALNDILSSDHPAFEGLALDRILNVVQEIDRKVKPWYATEGVLSETPEWGQIGLAFARAIRPILEENERLRALLDNTNFALAELRGGILITGGKVGEEPQSFIVSHEGWKGGICEQCGKPIKLRTTDEWRQYCSVECGIAVALEKFRRLCNSLG